MYESLSAMKAFATGTALIAHNVANVNTPDFASSNVTYNSGIAGTVEAHGTPHPSKTIQNSTNNATPTLQDTSSPHNDTPSMGENTVEIAHEMSKLILAQRGFEANAVVITTRANTDDALLGCITNVRT